MWVLLGFSASKQWFIDLGSFHLLAPLAFNMAIKVVLESCLLQLTRREKGPGESFRKFLWIRPQSGTYYFCQHCLAKNCKEDWEIWTPKYWKICVCFQKEEVSLEISEQSQLSIIIVANIFLLVACLFTYSMMSFEKWLLSLI